MKNVVYHSDCFPAMRKMKDNEFDLAIVDPPYGIGASVQGEGQFNYSTKKWRNAHCENLSKKEWDFEIPPIEYFSELKRVSKNQIIWGGNYFIENLTNTPSFIIWDKIIPPDFNKAEAELAWTSFNRSVKIFKFLWHGFQRGEQVKRIHPTQKPIKLYKWLLKNYAKEGDTILDTHVGSGSSRIACYEMGFDFTGYEIDKDYWEAQEKRFNIIKNQQTIW